MSPTKAPPHRPKILIADDNHDIIDSSAPLFELAGFEVTGVSRAQDILPRLRRDRPDVLLQDVHMPPLDVADLLRQIRSDPKLATLPVVLFTASVSDQSLWRTLDADGIVSKPFDVEQAKAYLEAVLRRGPHVSRRDTSAEPGMKPA